MMKQPSRAGLLVLLVLLWACTSQERWYEPSCIAYEGDRVMLRDDQFEWRKFTDQVSIGPNGEIMDPFPGYPKSGVYRQQHGRVEFKPDDSSQLDDHFMIEHLGVHYLLTEEQHQKFVAEGELQACVLSLVGAE